MAGKSKPKLDPTTVVVAVIGLVGTIIAAYITTGGFGGSEPPPSPVSTVSNDVAAPTSAPAASATSESSIPDTGNTPTSTSAAAPLLTIGEDWDQNCISAAWQAYPASSDTNVSDGCYVNLFNSIFSVQSGRLIISLDKRVESRETSGIFAELPSNSIVSIKIHLDDLQTGEIWIGVFDQPDILSEGYFFTIQGNEKEITFFALEMPAEVNAYKSGKVANPSGNYSVSLDITQNTVFGTIDQYTKTGSFSLPSEKKWLFIGYHALTTGRNRIQGNFYDFKITPR